jgi:hypothetical protein
MEGICLLLSVCGFLFGASSFVWSIIVGITSIRRGEITELKNRISELEKRVDSLYKINNDVIE